MRLSPAFLDELRNRTSLSALIGQSVKLQRAGREWRACCPFHDERSPSFYVNDDKSFYHCFGCSAHGDAIRWLTEQQGMSFIDAVKQLADGAGMTLPAPDPRAAEREERAVGLHEVMAAAAEWFTQQLHGDAGEEARAYLAKRGVTSATAETFALGFAPDSRGGLKAALARFGDDLLVEAGLLILVEEKAPYDRFRGRLMIPIRDPRGRVIAFGGRILGVGEPKYLNSPDTPLFDKGRTLYNLDRAAAAGRKAGRLIVVEGYLDVIALAQAGIEEVVAPLGTALTEAQIERLWRVVDVPIVCLDGDGAGRKAAVRAGERALPILAPGRSLAFALLPDGRDPDDVLRSGGADAIAPLLAGAMALVDLIWAHERDAAPLATPEARAGLKRRLDERVATIADAEVRRHYQAAVRERIDQEFFARRRQTPFGKARFAGGGRAQVAERRPGSDARTIGGGGIDAVTARAVLSGLLRHPILIVTCAEALAALPFADDDCHRLRARLLELSYDGATVDQAMIDTISHEIGLETLIVQLRRANGLAFSFVRPDAEPEVARRDLAMVIEALASRPELDAALDAATARLAMGSDVDWAEQARLRLARADVDRVLASLAQGDDD